MKKEPIWLYLFKLLIGLGLFIFMVMLYWSSNLLEENMISIRDDLNQLKTEVTALSKQRPTQLQQLQQPASETQTTTKERSHIDPNLPNLLITDQFYTTTLPQKLLPPDFKPHGVRQGAAIGKPDNLHPFSNWANVSTWVEQCNVSVATQLFGIYETLSPDMAIKMEERKIKGTDIPEFWVHLRDNVFWEPLSQDFFPESVHLAPHFLKKHQVTAHDFKFFIDVLMNPFVQEPGAAALRNYLGDIQELEVIDDLTFIVRWKAENVKESDGREVKKIKYIAKQMTGGLKPLASFVFKYFPDGKKIIEDDSDPNTYRTNSVLGAKFFKTLGQEYYCELRRLVF